MLVIEENAEEKLYQELKSCWESSPTHRCLHLKFSQAEQSVLEQNVEEWFLELTQTLHEILDDKSARIYLCHDQDVFILTRYMTKKRVSELLAHLSPKLVPALRKKRERGLAVLFEIGVDWPKLRVLCEKKIENLEFLKKQEQKQKQKKKKKQENLVKASREEVLKTLNSDLISSLAMRRDQREQPEIMVVEDDPFSQKLISNVLKSKYPLSMSDDGQGAIMNYVNKAPDVLFLDIDLPDIDGHEVLEKLFKLDPDAYVIMFSGNGDKENIMKAMELGAKGFIGKPFTKEKLFQYIEKSPFIQAKQA